MLSATCLPVGKVFFICFPSTPLRMTNKKIPLLQALTQKSLAHRKAFFISQQQKLYFLTNSIWNSLSHLLPVTNNLLPALS